MIQSDKYVHFHINYALAICCRESIEEGGLTGDMIITIMMDLERDIKYKVFWSSEAEALFERNYPPDSQMEEVLNLTEVITMLVNLGADLIKLQPKV